MHVLIDSSTRVVLAYGTFTADPADASQDVVDIDDSEAVKFEQPGIKTLEADGSISISVDQSAIDAENAAIAQREAAAKQRTDDAQVLMAALPTQEARDALARLLGL